jgi:hypothetical protein
MYENNEPIELSREQLEARIQELTNQIWTLSADLNSAREKNQVLSSTLDKAANWVREGIEGSTDPKETIEEYQDLIDILGVELTRKVEIEISVSWRGSIELPYGVEVEDLDVDDFDISISQHNEYDSDISYYFEDSSISERRW